MSSKPLNPNVMRANIQRSLRDLPPLPTVVLRVLKESESTNSSANNMQELIQTDHALAGKVLRVVNSPYYGLSGQVTSLLQACVILGNQQIRNLVMSMGVMSVMQPKNDSQMNAMRQSWMHSLAASLAVQAIARKRGIAAKDFETLFVASLLHDIGHLYLLCNFAEAFEQINSQAGQTGQAVREIEAKLVGLSHAEIGATMAEQWKLPSQLVELIRAHEGPFEANTSPLALIVHMGDELTKYLYRGEEPTVSQTIDPLALAWFNPQGTELEDILTEANQKVQAMSSSLGMAA
jgi:putative nucleotidyltransferase with HDIG domain